MPRRIRLTTAVQQQIIAGIRAGAYPHVAAEAAGVPVLVFAEWLRRGQQDNDRRYRPFYEKVRQAQAQARLKAEVDARNADARFWLRYGPGKETADSPGWSAPVKAAGRASADTQPLASPEWNELWGTILQALQAFPEARVALIQALGQEPPAPPTR
jgi:hypothetical protein